MHGFASSVVRTRTQAELAGEIFEAIFERATVGDVNAVDFNGLSLLHVATRVGNVSMMNRYEIGAGADHDAECACVS